MKTIEKTVEHINANGQKEIVKTVETIKDDSLSVGEAIVAVPMLGVLAVMSLFD